MIDLLELIARDTRLRKVANSCGGEWAGPCPQCGGRDRFRVQPHAQPQPRWICRHCCERWSNMPGYLMWRDGLSYGDACTALGVVRASDDHPATAPMPRPANDVQPPLTQKE